MKIKITPTRIVTNKKVDKPDIDEDVEKAELPYIVGKNAITLGKCLVVCYKT